MPATDLDLRLLMLLRTKGHTAATDRAISSFSRFGEHGACWLALGLAGAVLDGKENRRRWLRGVRVVAGSYVANQAIKFVIRRRRPELPDLPPLTPTISRMSFPSAHATTSFAGARAYAGVAPPLPLYAIAIAFGISRPYLGVHYPTDVLAGAALGTLTAEVWPA